METLGLCLCGLGIACLFAVSLIEAITWFIERGRELDAALRDDPAAEAAADAADDCCSKYLPASGPRPPASDPRFACHWGCPRGGD